MDALTAFYVDLAEVFTQLPQQQQQQHTTSKKKNKVPQQVERPVSGSITDSEPNMAALPRF